MFGFAACILQELKKSQCGSVAFCSGLVVGYRRLCLDLTREVDLEGLIVFMSASQNIGLAQHK